MPNGEADESIITRFIVEADDAIAKTLEFNQVVQTVKEQLLSVAQETRKSFAEIRKGMEEAFGEKQLQDLEEFKKKIVLEPGAEESFMKQQAEDAKTFSAALSESIRQVNDEVKTQRNEIQANIQAHKLLAEESKKSYAGASQSAVEYRQRIEQIKVEIQNIAKEQKVSFADASKGLVESGRFSATQVSTGLRELNQGLQGAAKSGTDFGASILTLGGRLLGIVGPLGIILAILRGVISTFKQAAEEGLKLAQSIVKLSISTRALQRRGLDITFGDAFKQAENLRKEFGTFSRREAVEGIAQIQFLTRNFGFTNDQMEQTSKIAASLATVLGEDMGEEARKLALFLSSGYAESLQRAGLAVNRLTVAQEAGRLGFGDNYLALTEQQRAYAGLSLVLKQSADLFEDAARIQETLPGRYAKATAEINTALGDIGSRTTAFRVAIQEIKAAAIVGIANALNLLALAVANFAALLGGVIVTIGVFWKTLLDPSIEVPNLTQVFKDATKQFADFELRTLFPDIFDPFGDAAKQAGLSADELEEELNTVEDTYTKFRDSILDIMNDYATKMRDLNIDLQRDLAKIEEDGVRRREEINRQFAQRIADIDRDTQQAIAKERRDLANDLAKITRDLQRREEEARRNFRQKELEDEEKFQLRLKQLREDFIFDLEDAVRARDAKQIRRLTRQFNKEQKQLIDSRELEKSQRQRDFEEELEDLRRQAEERRAERIIQFNQRLEDIRIQNAIQRQEAEIAHQQELEDLNRRLAEQRADRLRQYNDQIRDLQRSINDRLRLLAQGLINENKLTQQGIDAVYQRLRAYFGPGGYVEQLYRYYQQLLSSQDLSFPSPTLPTGSPAPGGFAHGGTFIATRPISRTFGEVPELVSITPLNGLGRNAGKFFGDISGGDMPSRDGKLAIDLFLSPDLEARIRERSMQDMSDVLVKVQRSR